MISLRIGTFVPALAAAALLACGSSPSSKPTAPPAPPKIEKVVGIPDAAVRSFNDGISAVEQTPSNFAAAAVAFEAATTAYPTYDAAWLNLAFVFGKLGRHAEAVKAYRKVVDRGNVPKAVQLDFGRALMSAGEVEAAITEFESVLRAQPTDLGARNNLAAAYQRKGDMVTALRYVKETKLPLAVLMFTKAQGYEPKNAFAANNLGLAYFTLNDVPGAVEQFEKAIALDPSMDEARLNVASIYLDYLDYTTALLQFKAVRARFPKHYQAMVGEADALYGTAQYEQAANLYDESLSIRADNPEVLFRTGKIYEEQVNQPKKALSYYVRYRDLVKPGPNDAIHSTIQFLEQADTLQPQPKEPESAPPAPDSAPAPASAAVPESTPAPASAAVPASVEAPASAK